MIARAATLFLFSSVCLAAASDSWDKVKELKTGTELRIVRKNAKAPVLASMDEANEERLVVVVKKEQIAIPKAEIDRIEARPVGKSQRKVTKDSKFDNDTVPKDLRPAKPGDRAPGPSGSSGGGLTFGAK